MGMGGPLFPANLSLDLISVGWQVAMSLVHSPVHSPDSPVHSPVHQSSFCNVLLKKVCIGAKTIPDLPGQSQILALCPLPRITYQFVQEPKDSQQVS